MDIFRTCIHFLWVNVMFYDAVSMIHDAIRTANPFLYTVKFMFVSVRKNKTLQIKILKINRIRI